MTYKYQTFRTIFLSLIFAVAGVNLAHAQTDFIRLFEGNGSGTGLKIYSADITNDGGLLMVGRTDNYGVGSDDMIMIRLDQDGDTVFAKTYGGNDYESCYRVDESSTGNIFIGGYTETFGAGGEDALVIKTNGDGDLLWSKVAGGISDDKFYAVQATADGGVVCAGYTYSYGSGSRSEYIVKYNSLGSVEWTHITSNGDYSGANNIIATNDGGYVYVSDRDDGFGDDDICLTKLDFAGNWLWTKQYEGYYDDDAEGVVQTPDGGYAICGYTNSFGNYEKNAYLLRTDDTGNMLWAKYYEASESEYCVIKPLTTTQDGGFAIAGYTRTASNLEYDMFAMKLNSSGSIEWSHAIGGEHEGRAYSVDQDSYGNIIVCGRSKTWSSSFSGVQLVIPSDGDLSGNCYVKPWSPNAQSASFTSSNVSGTITSFSSGATVNLLSTNAELNLGVGELQVNVISGDVPCGENCSGSVEAFVNIDVNAPLLFSWDNGQYGQDLFNQCQGEYSVVVTDATGCSATANATIGDMEIDPIELCVITVDETSTKNQLVWTKPEVDHIESFNIYRNIAGTYIWIGNVPYDSLSHFTDQSSGINPAFTSYRYKISTLDSCGNESSMSQYHETIHVTTNPGQNGEVNLIWDNYEGFGFTYYRILRDDLNDGNFEVIDSVLSTNTTYSDYFSPSSNSTYVIEIVAPSCSATKAVNYNNSRSNVAGINYSTTMEEKTATNFKVYPNPAHDAVQITMDRTVNGSLVIYNMIGVPVLNHFVNGLSMNIDVSNLARGTYFIELRNNGAFTRKKLVIQ